MRALSVPAVLLPLLLCACSPPRRDYDVERIARVTDMAELMDVQATVADDLMKIAARSRPEDIDEVLFDRYADMGRRLQATAERMKTLQTEPGFGDYVRAQQEQAASLEASAVQRDAARTLEAARAIRATCRACHQDFR